MNKQTKTIRSGQIADWYTRRDKVEARVTAEDTRVFEENYRADVARYHREKRSEKKAAN